MSRYASKQELIIHYDPREYALYRQGDPACKYHQSRWKRSIGRSKHGEFPLVVVREHFRQLGYCVLAAEPELPGGTGFMLVSYPGKRRRHHPAYRRMVGIFGAARLECLNREADEQKRRMTGSAGGGDPDLFVYRGSDRFFVEVKWRDQITAKQKVTFPLIEDYCGAEVKIARILPHPPP